MTDKEQIIINGKKQYCKILFRCKHIDDTAAYDMMCEGIEIKPENAPVSDFELMLIENTNSPFGFSFVCKRNNKEDVWEHSGFGNSGACSLVTALLKQHTCKTQECEQKDKELLSNEKIIKKLMKEVDELKYENGELKEEIEALDRINRRKDEELLRRLTYASNAEKQRDRYRKALEEIEEYCDKQIAVTGDLPFKTTESDILDIINTLKEKSDG